MRKIVEQFMLDLADKSLVRSTRTFDRAFSLSRAQGRSDASPKRRR